MPNDSAVLALKIQTSALYDLNEPQLLHCRVNSLIPYSLDLSVAWLLLSLDVHFLLLVILQETSGNTQV